jgi:REP element-mobilizing transposase RayT
MGGIMKNFFSGKPPRYHQDYSIYFLTFCTDKRRMLLQIKELIAFTIMPDHIHTLVEIESIKDLSAFLRDFKKHTSKEIKKRLLFKEEHVWQRGTMDHCIRVSWEDKDFQNHLEYIFYNSYKHLRVKPKDFPFHNFIEVVQKGWLEIDFCDFDENEFPFRGLYEE